MEIYEVKINHLHTPIGFMMRENPTVGFKVQGADNAEFQSARIFVSASEDFSSLMYDSGEMIENLAVYPLPLRLMPRTRYFVRVQVITNKADRAQASTWFETGKMTESWQAEWITTAEKPDNAVPVLARNVEVSKTVKTARLYVGCGGLYEFEINGQKAGNEYLTPYCNKYSSWMQAITHDVTSLLKSGENKLEVTMANGWYKGRFALDGLSDIYGSTLALIAELHICYEDGSAEVICTDNNWHSHKSCYQSADIYDGVQLDFTRDTSERFDVQTVKIDKKLLTDRLSLPVVVKETRKVASVITTPKGEKVLDMGQNMVGWLRVDTAKFKDKNFTVRFFEVLTPEGNVYLDNIRSAKATFSYTSDGQARVTEPEFTFYGFRYAWIDGIGEPPQDAFTGCVAYSDMDLTGNLETSNPLVNRLFLNALWGQKGNFVDVPTDCPQRDERLGWTGDAQVFCGTANFNMDTSAFFAKYMYDMYEEQKEHGGGTPHFVPSFQDGAHGSPMFKGSSAAWADAATIIPWTNYLHSGDKTLLARQYPGMKAWIEYIRKQDTGSFLWDTGFHFGDWLALDTARPERPMGTTPNEMVASAYYLYSAELTAKAAQALGNLDDANEYTSLAAKIRAAMQSEFVSPNGRVTSDTQTAEVIALFVNFATDKAKTAAMLHKKIADNDGHLNTGFVGTAYLNRVLSDNGFNATAYQLLLNKNYPGWLYEVEKGATTIWERWNSIKPDGSLGDVSMNSFNHYAYGAVMEWMYRNCAGLQPLAEGAGFKKIRLAPQPSPQMEWLKASYHSPAGLYRSEWRISERGLQFDFSIPFGAKAMLHLPDAPAEMVINGTKTRYEDGMELSSGVFKIEYAPTAPYYTVYGLDSAAAEVLDNAALSAWLRENVPGFAELPFYLLMGSPAGTIQQLLEGFGLPLNDAIKQKISKEWSKIRSWSV